MRVSEFDYALPAELIAQHPAPERTASRLLHLDAASGRLQDLAFAELPGLVGARDALVLNDTRVIKARLAGRKASGGRIELFVERLTPRTRRATRPSPPSPRARWPRPRRACISTGSSSSASRRAARASRTSP